MEARRITEGGSSQQPNATATVKSNEFSGWNLFAQAVDRIHFIAYFFVILIFMGAYLGGTINQ